MWSLPRVLEKEMTIETTTTTAEMTEVEAEEAVAVPEVDLADIVDLPELLLHGGRDLKRKMKNVSSKARKNRRMHSDDNF